MCKTKGEKEKVETKPKHEKVVQDKDKLTDGVEKRKAQHVLEEGQKRSRADGLETEENRD